MKNIVTIGREYGSGGHEIGVKLAERMGFQFYDKDLIAKLADKLMLPADFMAEEEKKAFRRNIFNEVIPVFANGDGSQADYIFAQQGKFIVQLAEEGNCVFAGRRADYYLRDNPSALHVFLYADMDARTARIMQLNNCSEEEAAKKIRDMDKFRKTSYEYTTGRKWGDRHNYDRMLCTSTLGIDACVDELAALLEKA